jgi:outer membrane immunogenic protein
VRVLAGAIALAVGIGTVPASAADLSAPFYKALPTAPPAFSWTGCYVGAEAGGALGQSQHIAATSPTPVDVGLPITIGFNLAGAVAGGTIGCNYQISNVVFGIEDDLSWTNLSGSSPDIPPFGAGSISSTNERWIDTLRGRVGFAWDRFLIYGTGGAAFAGAGAGNCTAAEICASDSQTKTGWAAGGGGEWAIWTIPAGNLTAKVEYLHADFGTGLFISPPVALPGGGSIVSRNVRLTDDIVRAGLNWKFNWW